MKVIIALFSTLLIYSTANAQSFFMLTKTAGSGAGPHYRTITIPTSSVSSSLTNYTMVFNETQTWLKTVANGGEVQNANGYDITFSTDAAGTSLLNWEVETYNASTGQLVAWVQVPTVSSSSNTVIYLRYDQPAITTFQGGSAGSAWDGNYTGVYHMNDVLTASGQSVLDWTSNARNYTSSGTWTSAQTSAGAVGNAIRAISGNSDYLNISGTEPPLSGDFTIEGWVYLETTPSNTSFLWSATSFANDLNWNAAVGHLYTGGGDLISSIGTISTNTWKHMLITRHFDGTNYDFVWYYNGAQDNTATVSPGSSGGFVFNFPNLFYNGQIPAVSNTMRADEVRFSNIARSSAWVAAEYLNMNAPDTFYSIGTEN